MNSSIFRSKSKCCATFKHLCTYGFVWISNIQMPRFGGVAYTLFRHTQMIFCYMYIYIYVTSHDISMHSHQRFGVVTHNSCPAKVSKSLCQARSGWSDMKTMKSLVQVMMGTFRQLCVMTRGYPISYHIPIISSLNPINYSNDIPIPLTLWTTLDLHFPAGAAMTKFSLKRPTSLAGVVLWQTNLARSISAYLSNCEIWLPSGYD